MSDTPVPATQSQGVGQVTSGNFNANVQSVPNVAALRNFTALNTMAILCEGTATPGDGGQAIYWYNTSSTATDDGYTIIRPNGATIGAWEILPVPVLIGPQPVIFSLSYGGAAPIPSGGRLIASVGVNCTIAANAAGCFGEAFAAATSTSTWPIYYKPKGSSSTQIGTVTFAASSAEPVFSGFSGAGTNLIAPGFLHTPTPGTPDDTLLQPTFCFLATRND